MTTTNEKVPFRFIACPECNHQVCWVNPRLPSYCPECGKHILQKLRNGDGIHETRDAWLRIERPKPDVHQSEKVECEGNPAECKRPEGDCPCMLKS